MSRVDVVIPCYNYARYLERCVASVLDQPDVNVRVLIIDDGSTDDSAYVAERLALVDKRITVRRHHSNHGHISTCNEGLLGWATGDYCLLIPAEDLVTPGALTRAAWVLDSLPNVGLCYGRQIVFSDVLPELAPSRDARPVTVSSGRDFWAQSCRTGQNLVPTPTAVVRTSVQQAVGGYRSELPHSGNLEMWLRIAGRADVASIDADQAFKRRHGQNMPPHHVTRRLEDLRQRRLAFESALADCERRLVDAARLGRIVHRTLSLEAFWTASREFERGKLAESAVWLTTAYDLDPSIAHTREWRRFQVKRTFGPKLWGVMQPWVERLRA